MSTRQRLPAAVIIVTMLLFIAATIPALLNEPQDWTVRDAEAGMRKNQSNQVVCAHLNTTAGAAHTTGTTTVYYHPNATTQTSAGTATHVANGVWCYTVDDAAEVNADIVKLAWINSGAVTVLQSYLTTGYDDSVAQIPVNLTHVNGTAVTADNALVGVKVNSMANDTITANAIATDAIGAQEIAASAIGADEIATDAITSSEIADNSIDSGAIANGAITSTEIATGAVDADALATDAVTEINDAIDARHGTGPYGR